jgi:hypothetical protein
MKPRFLPLTFTRAQRLGALISVAVILLLGIGMRLVRNRANRARVDENERTKTIWTLRPNGEFGGLEADFFLDGGRMHVYTAVEEVLSDKTGKYELSPDWDELREHWRGEAYYHETYDLADDGWVRRSRKFAAGPESNLEYGSCDNNAELDLPLEKEMKEELPAAVKIKAVLRFQEYAAIVYGDPNEQKPYPYNDHPPLEMDLLVPDRGGWRVADSKEVDEYGYLCGTTAFPTQLTGGEKARVFLIITSDPSATSNHYYVQSFLAREGKGRSSKQKN